MIAPAVDERQRGLEVLRLGVKAVLFALARQDKAVLFALARQEVREIHPHIRGEKVGQIDVWLSDGDLIVLDESRGLKLLAGAIVRVGPLSAPRRT